MDFYIVFFYFLIYMLGSSVGSFLCVCIYRIPENRSVIHPPSSCDQCGNRLKWYDMFPVFSALYLRGKCRNCGAKFSLRHALVEFLVGVLYVATVYVLGLKLQALLALFLSSVFVICFFTDLDRHIIPNKVILTGFLGGLVILFSMWTVGGIDGSEFLARVLYSAGATLLLLPLSIFTNTLGAGDVKLICLFGLFFGSYAPVAIGIGVIISGLFALVLLALRKVDRNARLPMAPFFAISFIGLIFVRLC